MPSHTIPLPPPQGRRRILGAEGERLAAEHLERLGYEILDRNWRHGRDGELDLVAADAGSIVAVEVKTRAGRGYGHPFEAITTQKLARLRRLLLAWVRDAHPVCDRLRIDAVAVTIGPDGAPDIEVLRGIG